jgi:uncharacterized integral membrane protein
VADDDEVPGDIRGRARLIGLVVVLGVLLWFALSNGDEVKVDFLVVETKVRLVYALAVAAVLGALADRIATFRNRRR